MIQVRHKKKMRAEGLFFYHSSLLYCPGQMLAVMELSQHVVSSSKTIRSIIPRGVRCVGPVKIMWSAVCLLAPHLQFPEEARPHLCGRTETPNTSTQAIEFDPCCSGQTHSNRSCADPRNVDTEPRCTLGVFCVPCQVRPLGSTDAQLR